MRVASSQRAMLCLSIWAVSHSALAEGAKQVVTTPSASAATATPAPSSTESAPTVATPPAPAAGDLKTQAQTHFQAGVKAYDAGRFGEAAEQFALAQSLMPHPDVLLNLAQSELKAVRYADAATHLHAYLAQIAPQENAEARLAFTEARRQVTQLTVNAPERAAISLDGAAVGTAPLSQPLFVLPGTHQLKAGPVSQTIIAEGGGEMNVHLQPGDLSAPTTGHHPRTVDEWFRETPVAWAGVGLSVASLVVSGLSAGTASTRYESANNAKGQILDHFATEKGAGGQSPCGPPAFSSDYAHACDVYTDKRDSGDTWKTVSIVSLVVGVAAAGGTVAYYFLDPNRAGNAEAQPTAKLTLTSAPQGQGLALLGRF